MDIIPEPEGVGDKEKVQPMNVGDVYDACLNGGPSNGDGRSCADGGREGEFQLRVVVPGSDERVSSINAKDSGRIAEAEKKLRFADEALTYIDAGTATYKLYNRMILAEVLLADNQDAEAHGLLSKVRGVNPLMVAEFEDTGLKMLGLDRG